MKKYKISMGNPCSVGWQNMVPNESGRFCSQCSKTVVDFTVMTDEQVVEYLLTHRGVCGHFNKTQLGRTMVVKGPVTQTKKYWPAIAAMLVAGFFQVMPLQTYANNNTQQSIGQNQFENKVEPAHSVALHKLQQDSLISFRIQIVDSKNKKPIVYANVTIDGAGQFTSDGNGVITLAVNIKTMPQHITIRAVNANGDFYTTYVQLETFIKKPSSRLELIYQDPNMQVDGGELFIERE
jgi:hypothetical protein